MIWLIKLIRKTDGITYAKLIELISDTRINMSSVNPLYSLLAGNIQICVLHQNTFTYFLDKVNFIENNVDILDDNWTDYILPKKRIFVRFKRPYI